MTPVGYVLSLCDRTANLVRPWYDAGYECVCIDIQHPPGVNAPVETNLNGGSIYKDCFDVTAHPASFFTNKLKWDIVFAAPPCTHLAVSGARWFKAKGMDALIEALQVVNACRKICEASGAPYMIENPVSTLSTYWRKPEFSFDPCDYAGYLDTPEEQESEAYTKRTNLWCGGGFVMPFPKRVEPKLGSKMHLMPPSEDRGDLRSVTPRGFSVAVFEANRKDSEGLLAA